jgi:uncharacterized protein with FMN-binding domain
MKHKGLLITIGIFGLIAFRLLGATAGMGEIRKMVINDVDLTSHADGVYKGSYHKSRWTYDVEVTVADHKIVAVKNTNDKTKMAKGFNKTAALAIIKKQSPKIDAVSGATISTKAFGKAVENALNQK